MADVTPVVVIPHHYQRTECEALPGTPWLRPASQGSPAEVLLVTTWIGGLLYSLSAHSGVGVVVACLAGGLGAFLLLAFSFGAKRIQICPECLGAMGRGARRCPACHFAEG